MDENREMGPIATVAQWLIIGAVAYFFFILIRWMVTTRAGVTTTLVVGGFLLVVGIFNPRSSGSSAPPARGHTHAASQGPVSQDPNMGWKTVIRNGQICTSFNGQQFPCTPIR